jgi:hypothetical protein
MSESGGIKGCMIEHVNLGTVQRTESAMKDIGLKLELGLLFGYKAPSSALNPASFCSLAPSKRVASLPALHIVPRVRC